MRVLRNSFLAKMFFLFTCIYGFSNAQADVVGNNSPILGLDGQGNFVAVWQAQDSDSGNGLIQSAYYWTSVGSWSSPITISDSTQNAMNPILTMNSSGNAIAVWASYDGTTTWLQSSNLPLNGAWSTFVDISSSTDIVYPTPGSFILEMDTSNNLRLLWTYQDDMGNAHINASAANFGGGWLLGNISG